MESLGKISAKFASNYTELSAEIYTAANHCSHSRCNLSEALGMALDRICRQCGAEHQPSPLQISITLTLHFQFSFFPVFIQSRVGFVLTHQGHVRANIHKSQMQLKLWLVAILPAQSKPNRRIVAFVLFGDLAFQS